ncbi:glycosyltransferase family 2 protein [Pedobacter sp.]|uniref:glycosyltransferase family 2 protein n=1 Tax=Pedobacter sp. TaxID=1411316 RepID=UPI003D7F9793
MTSQPSISIITPVWNGLPFIKECIDSVLSQDHACWEMLISDNCSTDGTRAYLDTLKDPRIKIFKQESNLGINKCYSRLQHE